MEHFAAAWANFSIGRVRVGICGSFGLGDCGEKRKGLVEVDLGSTAL